MTSWLNWTEKCPHLQAGLAVMSWTQRGLQLSPTQAGPTLAYDKRFCKHQHCPSLTQQPSNHQFHYKWSRSHLLHNWHQLEKARSSNEHDNYYLFNPIKNHAKLLGHLWLKMLPLHSQNSFQVSVQNLMQMSGTRNVKMHGACSYKLEPAQ